MIKIIKATHLTKKIIQLEFSDHSWGEYDLQPLIDKQSELVIPLQNETYFSEFFLELGALCWKNGLELSAGSIHKKLHEQGKLHFTAKAA
jgi:hypothetical protein